MEEKLMQLFKQKPDIYVDGNNLNSIYENVVKYFENDNYKNFEKNALEFSKKF